MLKKATLFVKNWHSVPAIKKLITFKGINFGKVFEICLIDSIVWILEREKVLKEREKDHMAFLRNIFFFPVESLELFFYFLTYYFKKGLTPAKKIKKPVWFLTRHHSLFKLLPLFTFLKKNKINFQILIWAPSKKEWLFLLKNNLNFRLLNKSDNEKEMIVKSKKEARRLLANWQRIKKEKRLDVFLKKQSLQTFKDSIEKYLGQFFQRHVLDFCQGVFVAEEMVAKVKPCLFISTNDLDPTASIFVYTCQKNRIPTLMIQHGMIANLKLASFISDKIAVWGDYTKEILVKKLKRDLSSIVVTGSLFFDKEYSGYQYRQKFFGLLKKEKSIGVLTTVFGHPREQEEILKKIIKTLTGLKNIRLSIRTHPGQKFILIGDLIREKKLKAKINEPLSLKEFINNQDLILTQDTTAGLEAILLGKPLFYLNFIGKKDNMPYATSGAAIGVYKIPELTLKLKRFLDNKKSQEVMQKKQKEFIRKYLKLDGKSLLKTLELIKKSTPGG